MSVVIPVFNRADLLGKVLSGLVAQDFPPTRYEVIVCDDGSAEDLSQVVDEFKAAFPHFHYLRQANRGPASARNMGIRASRAPTILFLDSDVLPDRKLLGRLWSMLHQHDDWVGVEAQVLPVGGEDNALWDAPVCKTGGVYLTAAILYRADALKKAGGFDESFTRAACEDVELAVRAMQFGPIGFNAAALVYHPRRRRSFAWFWHKRKDWRFILYVALRHGFIGWPKNPSRHPRLKLIWCALVTQPAGRLIQGCKLLVRNPVKGGIAVAHALFSVVCGLLALPQIIFLEAPPLQNYLDPVDQN